MKAAVVRRFGEPLVIEELVLDPPRPSEVRVEIGAVAVCGSDIHAVDGAWGGALPAVYGHEAAGVVTQLGSGVDGVAIGDHAVVSLLRSCGHCYYCARGERHHCDGPFALGEETRLHTRDGDPVVQGIAVGAFAEEVVVHASQVAPIPAAVPLLSACLLACGVPTGYGAVVNTAQVPAGSSVAVLGVGGVGINCVQGAVAAGAFPIIAIDTNPEKLADAMRLGATHALEADAAQGAQLMALTAGRGADYAFVAVGNPRVVEETLQLVRPGGSLVIVGMSAMGTSAAFDMSMFAYNGKRVLGSRMGSTQVRRDTALLAQRYLEGELVLDELVTRRFPLQDINAAIDLARRSVGLRNVIVFEGVDA